jgi:L-aspartate oxidase
MQIKSDVLVIGGGIAGLTFALRMAEKSRVTLLMKDDFIYSSTQYAQGGINAVLSGEDSFESHIQDTLDCGYGICDEQVVRKVVNEGPAIIDELMSYGVEFTLGDTGEQLELHREGGHAHNRVVHAKDATGAEIMRALSLAVENHPGIECYKRQMAIDLIMKHQPGCRSLNDKTRVLGAYVLDVDTHKVDVFLAPVVYLATGGVGKVYPFTSNPHTATGDGIVMAYRAGIDVVNMEFTQFHPTLLYHPDERAFLISEAVRGEGGILRNIHGEAFMKRYHPDLLDLAPRDVVARAIDAEIKIAGHPCVYLDVTHLSKEHIVHHFPTIYHKLLELDIDITRQSIPVTPGAHYCCGGLRVNEFGQTDCFGLFAGGECTYTGLHGSNRLASNSLLEAAAYAKFSSLYLLEHLEEYTEDSIDVAPWVYHNYSDEYEESLVNPLWYEVRHFMWNYVGIIRTDKRLSRAMRRIEFLRKEIENSYWDFKISKDLVELRNISVIAELIIRSAMNRKESRGLHYNVDHPDDLPKFKNETCLSLSRQGLFREFRNK